MPKWQSESSRESLISNRIRQRYKIIHSQKTTQKQSARRSHPFADTMKACRALPAYDKLSSLSFRPFSYHCVRQILYTKVVLKNEKTAFSCTYFSKKSRFSE